MAKKIFGQKSMARVGQKNSGASYVNASDGHIVPKWWLWFLKNSFLSVASLAQDPGVNTPKFIQQYCLQS